MKILITICSVLLVLGIAAVIILNHPAFGKRQSKQHKALIEASPNYHNGHFRNQIPTSQFTGDTNFFKALWGFLTAKTPNKVPTSPVPTVKTDLKNLPEDTDWIIWFGHSSYLFQLGDKRFLVDPLLKMEFPVTVMMQAFKGTEIYSPNDLPQVDYLIITHEHWDHLDYATLRDIRHLVKHAVCPLGIAQYLEYWGYDSQIISELDWYDSIKPDNSRDDITISCLPTRHFSNRLFGANQTLWASFMVQAADRKVYIGGDGGYDQRFKQISDQFGTIDLAIMENGQYNKDWANIHLMPDDLEKAILDIRANAIFTVHHNKFALARHQWTEPDSVAQQIAAKDSINLLDQPIGTLVTF